MWCWGGKREKGGGSLVEGGGVVLSGVGQKLNRPATPQVRTIGTDFENRPENHSYSSCTFIQSRILSLLLSSKLPVLPSLLLLL